MQPNWVDFKAVKEAVTIRMVLDHYGVSWLRKKGNEHRASGCLSEPFVRRYRHWSLTSQKPLLSEPCAGLFARFTEANARPHQELPFWNPEVF